MKNECKIDAAQAASERKLEKIKFSKSNEMLKDGQKPSRGTKDIDFAIMISSIDEYENISSTLQKKGFNKVKAPWTFYSNTYLQCCG